MKDAAVEIGATEPAFGNSREAFPRESVIPIPPSAVADAPGRIALRHARKTWTAADDGAPAAIDIDAFDLPLGGIVAIVGSSGSGKSTLLNLLGGLEAFDPVEADAPTLELWLPGDERSSYAAGGARHVGRGVSGYPRERVSYVFQQGYLLSQASVRLNLEIVRRAAGLDVDDETLRTLMSAASLHLGEGGDPAAKTLDDRAVTLSGGQQQRLNIARALGREPAILFADEPTSSLDPQTAADVLSTLSRWMRGEVSEREPPETRDAAFDRTRLARTMVWVTHDYGLACRFADALVVMAPGRPMPGLRAPLELHGIAPAVTPADIEAWLRDGGVPDEVLAHQRPPGSFDAPERVPGIDDPTSQRTATGGADATGRRPATGRLAAARHVGANMRAGVWLSWMEAFRDAPSGLAARLGAFGLPLRFTHLVRALQLAAVLALILIVTHGRQAVVDYFDAALADPSLRHVIVQQNVRELERSVIDAASLAALDESIATGAPPPATGGFVEERAADAVEAERRGFGRFTEAVDVYPEGVDDIAPGYVAEAYVGIIEKAEPVYAGLEVLPLGDGLPGCDGAGVERVPPGALIDYADELVLIASRRYVEEAARMFGADLCAEPYVDLWDAGDPLTFRIAGVADRLPADGYERFDAILQADVWRTWVSRVGKPQFGSYSRAAVYFDRDDHARVLDALRARAFAFDEEIVSKFERLMTTAARLRNTFVAITWLSLGVAVTVAAGLIWSYLSQNAKAIALLRAHDAWRAPLIAAIPFQLTLTFLYSLAALGFAVLAWNALASVGAVRAAMGRVTGGAVEATPIDLRVVLDSLPTLALTWAAVVGVGLASLLAWRLLHPSLAHELRETE